jgi:hypothetical protein
LGKERKASKETSEHANTNGERHPSERSQMSRDLPQIPAEAASAHAFPFTANTVLSR